MQLKGFMAYFDEENIGIQSIFEKNATSYEVQKLALMDPVTITESGCFMRQASFR